MKLLSLLFLLSSISAFASNRFEKVMIIVFENTDFKDAIKQPYFSSLAAKGALLTNYKALTHPSQPNYIALISGSMYGVTSDRNVDLRGRHIGDLLEEQGLNWKVYAEGYPGNCFTGARSGKYVRKHVPFMSFLNVSTDSKRCGRIVGADQFFSDLKTGSLPEYSLFIPDMDNDAHDTNISYGDKWLKKTFDPVLNSPNFPKDLLIVITFDEGSSRGNNQIYTLFYGAGVQKNLQSSKSYNIYSLLKTIEDELHLPDLGQNDAKAVSIDDIWQN